MKIQQEVAQPKGDTGFGTCGECLALNKYTDGSVTAENAATPETKARLEALRMVAFRRDKEGDKTELYPIPPCATCKTWVEPANGRYRNYTSRLTQKSIYAIMGKYKKTGDSLATLLGAEETYTSKSNGVEGLKESGKWVYGNPWVGMLKKNDAAVAQSIIDISQEALPGKTITVKLSDWLEKYAANCNQVPTNTQNNRLPSQSTFTIAVPPKK
ncbi:hypothetical protein [uncultured Shewanella sp.]|uniref:hypothetical protein n=1 Tax=uncultured Shewanella sp. TaxID=173975 RepID=UPI00262489CC|nr:hypothetical protein [uncultured Shewanella sp.]